MQQKHISVGVQHSNIGVATKEGHHFPVMIIIYRIRYTYNIYVICFLVFYFVDAFFTSILFIFSCLFFWGRVSLFVLFWSVTFLYCCLMFSGCRVRNSTREGEEGGDFAEGGEGIDGGGRGGEGGREETV